MGQPERSEADSQMATWRLPVVSTWGGPGSPGVGIWHVRNTGDDTSSVELDNLSEAIRQFYSDIKEQFPDSVTFDFDGELVEIHTGTISHEAPAWHVQGNAGNVPLAPAAAMICLTMRTDSSTRSGRGRKFLGPVATLTCQADGTPTTAAIIDVQNAADTMIGVSTGFANGAIGVYSPTQDLFRDVLSATISDQFAVLRSRRN